MNRTYHCLSLGCLALLAAVVVGCDPPSAAPGGDRSRRLEVLVGVNRTISAKSEAELKEGIQQLPPDRLDEVLSIGGATSPDELFISDRDGKPYVVYYAGQRPKGVAQDVVAFEQVGVDGKRLVAYGLGSVVEVDEQRFNELVPEAHRPKN